MIVCASWSGSGRHIRKSLALVHLGLCWKTIRRNNGLGKPKDTIGTCCYCILLSSETWISCFYMFRLFRPYDMICLYDISDSSPKQVPKSSTHDKTHQRTQHIYLDAATSGLCLAFGNSTCDQISRYIVPPHTKRSSNHGATCCNSSTATRFLDVFGVVSSCAKSRETNQSSRFHSKPFQDQLPATASSWSQNKGCQKEKHEFCQGPKAKLRPKVSSFCGKSLARQPFLRMPARKPLAHLYLQTFRTCMQCIAQHMGLTACYPRFANMPATFSLKSLKC